jgi:hypothetical protein
MSLTFFLVYSIILFLHSFLNDTIIKYEYKNYYNNWVKDGKPSGYFWNPKNEKISFISKLGFLKDRWSWFISTPDWIKGDKKGLALLRIYRAVYLILIILSVYMLIMILIYGKNGRLPIKAAW